MSFDEQPDPLSDCMEAYDKLKAERDALQAELDKAKAENDRLRGELAEALRKLVIDQEAISDMQSQIVFQAGRAESAEANLAQAEKDLADYKAGAKAEADAGDEARVEVARLTAALEAEKQKSEAEYSLGQHARESYRKLEAERDALQAKLAQAEKEIASLQLELARVPNLPFQHFPNPLIEENRRLEDFLLMDHDSYSDFPGSQCDDGCRKCLLEEKIITEIEARRKND